MAPCNGAHDTGYVPAKSVRELLIFFETEAKRLQAGSGGGGKNGMSSPRAEPGTCCIASREESRAAQQARRRFRGHNRIAPMKNQGANAEKLQNVAATETQQQQQQQQQEDAVGAWARPGLRWLGETNELLYGLSLAECQQACLAKAPQECDLYTFMAENEDVGEGRSACYIYSDQNQSQTVSLDLSGCGTVSGCHYASGSRRCYVPDKHDGTFGNLII